MPMHVAYPNRLSVGGEVMAGKTFTAQLQDAIRKREDGARDVFRQSVQDVLHEAQRPRAQGGRLPVDTAFLRNSLVSEGDGAPRGEGADSYVFTIAGLELGATAHFAWTAAYARRIEFGFSGQDALGRTYQQGGAHFVGAAAARWQEFVDRNARRLR